MQITRRDLLGAIGIGTIGIGGVTLGRGSPGFTNYTYADNGDVDDRRLRVAWYEQYNGRFLENQDGTTDPGLDDSLDPDSDPRYVTEAAAVTGASGPVIAVGDVVPGDSGTLVIGLEVTDEADVVAEPLDIWGRATITGNDENGINGPEGAAGDASTTIGELADDLTVELWRDGSPLGTCNGRKDVDESLGGPIVPRAPMSVAFGPSGTISDPAGHKLLDGLSPGATRCIAFAWEFPWDTATNRSQGDSIEFTLAFAGGPVGADSPFTNTGEDA